MGSGMRIADFVAERMRIADSLSSMKRNGKESGIKKMLY